LRDVLRHRDFRMLLAGYSVSATGDWLYSVALIVYVFQVTGSPTWVAITSFIRFAPVVVLGPIGGAIADRYDRKTVMIVSDLARFGIMAILTAVAAVNGPALAAALCAGAAVVFASAYQPAVSASIPTLVGEGDLAPANTLASVVENLALAIGPAIGGVLLILGSPAIAFGINAVTFLVSAAFTAVIRTSLRPAEEAEGDVERLSERVRAGIRAIRSSSVVKLVVVVSVTFTLFYGVELVLYVAAAHDLLRIGDDGLAFMWAASGVGGILMAGVTNRIAARPQLSTALTAAALVTAVPMICLSFVHVPALVYALMVVEGAAIIVADVVYLTMLQRTVDGAVLGRVFGILDSLMVGGILVGNLLAPVLVAVIGLDLALVVGGGILVVVAVLVLPRARALDREAAARSARISAIADQLARADIFSDATRPVLEGLAAATTIEPVPAGTVVVREGDPADDLFVVVDGTLEVTSKGEGRVVERIRELGPTDQFGEIGVLEHRPRTATVTAVTDSELYRIGGEDFLRATTQAPRLSGRVLRSAALRLARTHPSESLGHA
jgi:MFS family permease